MPNLTCKYNNELLVAYRDYDFDIRQLGKERKLQCQKCGKPVYFRKGNLGRIEHFAHFPSQQTLKCSGANESPAHYECKGFIAKLLETRYSNKNVFPEHTVESGQEADILLIYQQQRSHLKFNLANSLKKNGNFELNYIKDMELFPFGFWDFEKESKNYIKAHIPILPFQ